MPKKQRSQKYRETFHLNGLYLPSRVPMLLAHSKKMGIPKVA